MDNHRNSIIRTLENKGEIELEIYDDCGNVIDHVKTDRLGKIYHRINNVQSDESYKIVNMDNSQTYNEHIETIINNS